jgi:hypothetical protein
MKFEFIGVKDCGETTCPHCGAEGRYIYEWAEDGQPRAAMAGCYKLLTGKLEKNDVQKAYQTLAEKQAKNKPLNGWEKTIMRMEAFKAEGKYSKEWCDEKIREAVSQKKMYASGRRNF